MTNTHPITHEEMRSLERLQLASEWLDSRCPGTAGLRADRASMNRIVADALLPWAAVPCDGEWVLVVVWLFKVAGPELKFYTPEGVTRHIEHATRFASPLEALETIKQAQQ